MKLPSQALRALSVVIALSCSEGRDETGSDPRPAGGTAAPWGNDHIVFVARTAAQLGGGDGALPLRPRDCSR